MTSINWSVIQAGDYDAVVGHNGSIIAIYNYVAGAFFSTDGGDNWTAFDATMPIIAVSDSYIYWSDYERLYRYSISLGGSSEDISPIVCTNTSLYRYTCISCSTTGDKLIVGFYKDSSFVSTDMAVAYSDDYGDSFSTVETYNGANINFCIYNVLMNSDGVKQYYVCRGYESSTVCGQVYYRSGSGSWSQLITTQAWTYPIAQYSQPPTLFFQVSDDGTVMGFPENYSSNYSTFPLYYRYSTNSGSSWNTTSLEPTGHNKVYARLGKFAISEDGQYIFIYLSPQTGSYPYDEEAYYSDDSGASFSTPTMSGQSNLTSSYAIRSSFLGDTLGLLMYDGENVYTSAASLIKAISTVEWIDIGIVGTIARADVGAVSSQEAV